MDIKGIEEYIDLIDQMSKDKLYKVFDIFNQKLEILEKNIEIYDFHITYLKEIKVLEEFEIIKSRFDEMENCNYYEVIATQLELAKVQKLFKDRDPLSILKNNNFSFSSLI